MSDAENILDKILKALPELRNHHATGSASYLLLDEIVGRAVRELFAGDEAVGHRIGSFGELVFPYTKMGAIDSLHLFGLDELIIFSFYWTNRQRYRRTLDLGANIGLHSFMMGRAGFDVTCYEPDPTHFNWLQRTLKNNDLLRAVRPVNEAISSEPGTLEFVRVLGNTTGSHLAGSKSKVYGDLERFPVTVAAFGSIIKGIDLIKMDVEGHERVILTATTAADWATVDCIAEIGSEENAAAIFEHFQRIGINLFAQKLNWQTVTKAADMPTSYRDGSLFISAKTAMPWHGEPG